MTRRQIILTTEGAMRTVVWEGFLDEKAPEPGWGVREARPHLYPSLQPASRSILQDVLNLSNIQI